MRGVSGRGPGAGGDVGAGGEGTGVGPGSAGGVLGADPGGVGVGLGFGGLDGPELGFELVGGEGGEVGLGGPVVPGGDLFHR